MLRDLTLMDAMQQRIGALMGLPPMSMFDTPYALRSPKPKQKHGPSPGKRKARKRAEADRKRNRK